MSTSPAAFAAALDHLSSSSEKLCYVHCNLCDTVLAVSVPCTSLFKTVTVRCGHCTNLLSVNMRALLLPTPNQLHFGHSLLSAPTHHSLLDEIVYPNPSLLLAEHQANNLTSLLSGHNMMPPAKPPQDQELPHHQINPPVSRPPEKRQRVPSAYNRFIKDEIQRIKAGNPDISHREAFSAAAKNWAHFPHIHFGLMPDQGLQKTTVPPQGQRKDTLLKDGFQAAAAAAAAANMGVTPF